jgi:hypothetical protein
MSLQDIKDAIENGQRVFWCNDAYEVIKDCIGQYLIRSHFSDTPNYVGLTWTDGVTVNGKPEEFYAVEGA